MQRIAPPSVQSLLIQMLFNGQSLATGTAFLAMAAAGPVLLTNRHNVTRRDQNTGKPISATGGLPNQLSVLHNRAGQLGQGIARTEPLFAGDLPRWHEHPTLGSTADFVALPLTQLEDVACHPHDVANVGPDIFVETSNAVRVIGFPFGMTVGGAFGV
jgi:hypothetical protein